MKKYTLIVFISALITLFFIVLGKFGILNKFTGFESMALYYIIANHLMLYNLIKKFDT